MTGQLAVLCYHRVLPDADRTGDGWPYFSRGTAVSLSSFSRQVEQLVQHVTLVDEAAVSAWADGRTELDAPSAWITFDDGYADVVEHAAPVLAAVDAAASVFVSTCTLATPPRALPADRWYSALARARRRRGTLVVGGHRWVFDLNLPDDRARLVDGPERRRCLRAPEEERDAILATLGEALDAPAEPSRRLYLLTEELRGLVRRDWSIGAHGATHRPFPVLDPPALTAELDQVDQVFARHGFPRPAALAYPDAAWSEGAEGIVATHGYRLGLLLGNQVTPRQPLRICRFVVPDEPRWVEQTLLPALGRRG
ncbi:polysaccharide deacetylase family protein [Sorangium cellulosum]|uniref:NodB homology domain-containing protein n=1 Tax=Sorangium cellulosum So0157-2 TaxID=1254432 RepID=S4Y0K1_SORCE|nr:polysaccharide deacetylase family protein [Sorangium cellulosum]AGP36433.1 hypothetical protein SCE1572_19225 [Sorangium cellulosum So0157-2]